LHLQCSASRTQPRKPSGRIHNQEAMNEGGFILSIMPLLLNGAITSVLVALAAVFLGVVLGIAVCQMRRSDAWGLPRVAGIYISFLRGIPVLVILFLLFYLPAAINVELPSLLVAVLALGLNTSAFQAEIYRGGFNSIPVGQIEAAKALGLSRMRILTRIQLPQVLSLTGPELVNEFIILFKNSSLISVIGVTELMRRSEQIVSTTYRPVEVYLAAAIIYLVLCICISRLGERLKGKH
jgi:polar amino acid transport system permease protein